MYTKVNFFKMEKKTIFDGRDYEKLWIASITFFSIFPKVYQIKLKYIY